MAAAAAARYEQILPVLIGLFQAEAIFGAGVFGLARVAIGDLFTSRRKAPAMSGLIIPLRSVELLHVVAAGVGKGR